MLMLIYFFIGKPKWKDLYKYVIPRYATKWKRIGAILGLSTGELEIIENDCRDKAESCCRVMFEKWFDKDHTPTWGKLFEAGIDGNSSCKLLSNQKHPRCKKGAAKN